MPQKHVEDIRKSCLWVLQSLLFHAVQIDLSREVPFSAYIAVVFFLKLPDWNQLAVETEAAKILRFFGKRQHHSAVFRGRIVNHRDPLSAIQFIETQDGRNIVRSGDIQHNVVCFAGFKEFVSAVCLTHMNSFGSPGMKEEIAILVQEVFIGT